MARLRILLADDHTVVRQGLRRVLEDCAEWEVVAEAGDGREAVRQAEELKPDVAIIDIAMPLLNGIEATRQIVKRLPSTRILILTMQADVPAMRADFGRMIDGFIEEITADMQAMPTAGNA